MSLRVLRSLLPGLLPIALVACMGPEPAVANQSASASVPLGVDLGGAPARALRADEREADAGAMPGMAGMASKTGGQAGPMQMAHEGHSGAHATGTVTAVNVGARKLSVSHDPISALGWPAMTMEFAVAPPVDLKTVKPGARVNFTLEKGADGMYVIQSVDPAGGRR